MKKIIIISVIAFLLPACQSCKSSGNNPPQKITRDTTTILAVYKSAQDGEPKADFIKRVVLDTFTYFDTDKTTKKKMWGKDTFYIITYTLAIDSALSKTYNKPIKDSAGRQNYMFTTVLTDKKYVRSGWNKIDSAFLKEIKDQK